MAAMDFYPLVDLALARRLERTEARANVEAVESRAAMQPESGATWTEVGGTFAMFDLKDSPLTQTFGLGMFQPVVEHDVKSLEDFFESRGARVFHEVSPLADPNALQILNARRYQPIEFTSVMYRPIAVSLDGLAKSLPTTNANLTARRIAITESELWAKTAASGWSDFPEFTDLIYDLGLLMATGSGGCCFVAEIEGVSVASAAMSFCDGVALLAGASTIPNARGQGAQSALLVARLQEARNRGCELAMMCAAPGSASQRNAERNGFRIAYTRIKWMKV